MPQVNGTPIGPHVAWDYSKYKIAPVVYLQGIHAFAEPAAPWFLSSFLTRDAEEGISSFSLHDATGSTRASLNILRALTSLSKINFPGRGCTGCVPRPSVACSEGVPAPSRFAPARRTLLTQVGLYSPKKRRWLLGTQAPSRGWRFLAASARGVTVTKNAP